MKRGQFGAWILVGGLATVVASSSANGAPAHAPAQALVPLEPAALAAAPAGVAASTEAPVNAGLKLGATPVEASSGTGSCPADMQEVEGDYCSTVEQKCLRWLDPDTKMRCAEFSAETKCTGKTTRKHFCIDRFEWPNRAGEKPVVMKSWYEARDACAGAGKRLCGDSEWTLACEGQERLPYPYGYARNADACNIDKPHPDVDEAAIANPKTRDAEVARLDQRDPSAFREACVSPFGVHDMTGNVDEWVVNEGGAPFKSGLKGGYWGPVRTRCRPMTTAHNELFQFYQIGFRCCSDGPKDGASPPGAAAPAGGGLLQRARPSVGDNPGPAAGI